MNRGNREPQARPNVDLRIERVVLDGFDLSPGERRLVQAGLEGELSRLLGESPWPPAMLAGGAAPSLRADGISLEAGLAPRLLGERIARAVYRSLAGGVSAASPWAAPAAGEGQA